MRDERDLARCKNSKQHTNTSKSQLMQMRQKSPSLRDYGIVIGDLPTGTRNAITDVADVRVGHVSLNSGTDTRTGVTCIIPRGAAKDLYDNKLLAASHVVNGFGKAAGMLQVNELGSLETPIVLTNTLSVGSAVQGTVWYMLHFNKHIGDTASNVNSVVLECSDAYLNDIRQSNTVRPEHVVQAIESASDEFEQGSVGAGTGMWCFGLKGGIGSSSRVVRLSESLSCTFGVLVLSNYGTLSDFMLDGVKAGKIIENHLQELERQQGSEHRATIEQRKQAKMQEMRGEGGSIIVVIATDAPLSERQLTRICKRAEIGIARTGSQVASGSGDIVVGFTTAHTIPQDMSSAAQPLQVLHESLIDQCFRAVIEATEEAILNSMIAANTTTGRNGRCLRSLREYMDIILPKYNAQM